MTPAGQLAEAPRSAEPFVLPRDEMAFRGCYEGLLRDRRITTVFRPGIRIWPNWRGYIAGETVTARVIEQVGCDALRLAPRFNSVRVPIHIQDLAVLDIGSLTSADFDGSSPDVTDKSSLLAHLFEIYGQPIEAYGGQVTRIRFTYPGYRWRRPRRW